METQALVGGAKELLPGLFSLFLHLSKLTHTWPEGAGRCGVKGIFLKRDLPLVLRENFAKICFETLLQYSLLDQMRWKLNTMSLQRSPS